MEKLHLFGHPIGRFYPCFYWSCFSPPVFRTQPTWGCRAEGRTGANSLKGKLDAMAVEEAIRRLQMGKSLTRSLRGR